MKYYSEVLDKAFDTEDACLGAEKAYEAEVKAKEDEKKALSEKRKARAEEVQVAREKAAAAYKEYKDLLTAFCKDYGAFHYSIKNDNDAINSFFESIFKWF